VRSYTVQLFPTSAFFPRDPNVQGDPGGLHFSFAGQTVFRGGGTVDLDVNLPFNIRLLAGGEFSTRYRGSNVEFSSPTSPTQLPILCPVQDTAMGGFSTVAGCPRAYITDTGRIVGAGYVDAQWHRCRS